MAHNMKYTIAGTDLKEVARFFSKFTKKSKVVPSSTWKKRLFPSDLPATLATDSLQRRLSP